MLMLVFQSLSTLRYFSLMAVPVGVSARRLELATFVVEYDSDVVLLYKTHHKNIVTIHCTAAILLYWLTICTEVAVVQVLVTVL